MSGAMRILDPAKASYSWTTYGMTPAATPTDVVVVKGAALTLIKVRRILISGLATVAGDLPFDLIRRSAVNTGGTKATAVTPVKRDLDDGAAAAAVDLYTANPSALGTAVGTLLSRNLALIVAGAAKDRAELFFGLHGLKPIHLSSATDFLAINFKGGSLPTNAKLDFEIDWTEESVS